jgi:hypothetical protein
LIFFKMGDKKNLLGKYMYYPGKPKITKVDFRMNFSRLPNPISLDTCNQVQDSQET